MVNKYYNKEKIIIHKGHRFFVVCKSFSLHSGPVPRPVLYQTGILLSTCPSGFPSVLIFYIPPQKYEWLILYKFCDCDI